LDQAGRPAGDATPDGRALPDTAPPAADEAAAQLSGASAAALAALCAAEAEATRAAVLKARSSCSLCRDREPSSRHILCWYPLAADYQGACGMTWTERP